MCNLKFKVESEKEIKLQELRGHRSKDRPLNKRETVRSPRCLKAWKKVEWCLVEVLTGMHVTSPVTSPKGLLRDDENTPIFNNEVGVLILYHDVK